MKNAPHSGTVDLRYEFEEAHAWLDRHGSQQLETRKGTPFEAEAWESRSGPRVGAPVIRFRSMTGSYARAYECCWGAYYSHHSTFIGMFCRALDEAIANSHQG
ncbi:MAG: hypothetical protein ACP5G7_08550 [Anaerolineae bacterium]